MDMAELAKKLEELQSENASLRRQLRTSTSGTLRKRVELEEPLTPAQRETLLVSAKRKLYKQASEKIDEALRAHTLDAKTRGEFDALLQTLAITIHVSIQSGIGVPSVKVSSARKRSQSKSRMKADI